MQSFDTMAKRPFTSIRLMGPCQTNNRLSHNLIYVTGKRCNQAFREMPKNSRHFVKSLIHLGISQNA